jgi:hypothetical protein
MARLCNVLSQGFGTLVVVLLVLGVLTASPYSWAEEPCNIDEECPSGHICVAGVCKPPPVFICTMPACQNGTGGCESFCAGQRCDDVNPNKTCVSTLGGCLCQ